MSKLFKAFFGSKSPSEKQKKDDNKSKSNANQALEDEANSINKIEVVNVQEFR